MPVRRVLPPPDDPVELPDDPVVRMPKHMYAPTAPREPSGAGPSAVLAVAGLGAGIGAALGAVGLAIVWTTLPPPPPRVHVAPAARPE